MVQMSRIKAAREPRPSVVTGIKREVVITGRPLNFAAAESLGLQGVRLDDVVNRVSPRRSIKGLYINTPNDVKITYGPWDERRDRLVGGYIPAKGYMPILSDREFVINQAHKKLQEEISAKFGIPVTLASGGSIRGLNDEKPVVVIVDNPDAK